MIYANLAGIETKYLKDGHGNVTGLANMSGTTLNKSYHYDAFGVEKDIDTTDKNPFRYCGEYYDKENDSIYLRARYYKPNTGRFITEDPVKDDLNWYVYCGNEPVMLVDPSGLKLKLEGSAEEQQIVIDYLRVLTRDSLDIDGDGFVQVTEQNKNTGVLKAGTDLIYQLIIDDNTCTITIGKNNGTAPTIGDWDNASNGGTDATVVFNPYKSSEFKVYNEVLKKVRKETANPCISLAHECIHALREMWGIRNSDTNMATNNMPYGQGEQWLPEEFETVGIDYTDSNGVRHYVSGGWYTENAIRAEHVNANERVRYN